MLTPNNSPFVSQLWNDPERGPLLQANGKPLALGDIDETTGLVAPDGSTNLTPQGSVNMLMSLRAQFPFLPIIPMPQSYVSLFMNANTARDLQIPDGMSLMLIRGSADYYMSTKGNAEVPTALNTSGGSSGNGIAMSFYAPQGILYYVGDIHSLSVIAPTTGTIVTAQFWAPDQLPR